MICLFVEVMICLFVEVMEEIPNNHLGCTRIMRDMDQLPISTAYDGISKP